MSNLKVNIISPYTGSTVTIVGFNATGSLDGTASYADVAATASYATGYTLQTDFDTFTGSYVDDSGSFNSRITAQEQFSSSLDTTFVNETEFANYTGSADSRFNALEIESGSIRNGFNAFTASYTVDSGSFDSRVTDLETFSSSLDTSFVSEIEFGSYTGSNDLRVSALELESGSIRTDFNTYTSSADLRLGALELESGSIRTDFNSFTSSYIIDSGSFDTRVTDLEQFSSSLDNTFVNETDFATYTGSVDLVLNALETESGSIRNDLNSYTGSNDLRVTALELESGSIRTTLNSYTASSDLRLNSLEIESGSIRTDFNTFTASYTTGSFTGSFTGDGSGLTDVSATTASYYVETDPVFTSVSGTLATTGSNTFNGTQIINGDVTISGTASIDYLHVTYESASVIYSSGSNQLGDEVSDTQTLIGSTIISGSLSVTGSANIPSITGSLQGTATNANTSSYVQGANVDGQVSSALNSVSSSYILGSNVDGTVALSTTASYALNAGNSQTATSASYILGSNVDGQVSSALSSSYAITASHALNVPATASYALTAETASYILGSNVDGAVNIANTASYVETAQTASYILGSNVSGAVANATTSVTASYILAAGVDGTVANSVSSSYAITASYALNGGGGTGSLATLSDTTITTPATNDILIYDGATWINSATKTTVATTLLIANWIVDGDYFYQDITHNLNTEDVKVTLFDNTTKETILPDRITRTSVNVVRVHISINTIDVRALVSPEQLIVQNSSGRNVVSNPSSPYTAQNNDIIIWDVSGGSGTVILPPAASAGNFRIDIKKTDSSANTITVDPNASELIEGGTSAVITTQYEAISTVCDSTQWWIIASF